MRQGNYKLSSKYFSSCCQRGISRQKPFDTTTFFGKTSARCSAEGGSGGLDNRLNHKSNVGKPKIMIRLVRRLWCFFSFKYTGMY